MRRLILLRHAKAEKSAPLGGGDFERPLTARGLADAAAAGRWLAEQGYPPDLALVSPATRARQTWDEAAASLPGVRAAFPESLYAADPRDMLARAEQADVETVVVVAHNPGLHGLAEALAQAGGGSGEMRAALREGLPTATLAVFRADGVVRWVGEALHVARAGDR